MWALVAVALAGGTTDASSRPELRWHTIATDHFDVHFPVSRRDPDDPRWLSGEGTARRIAATAEALWLPLSDEVGYFPRERIEIVVLEHVDELVGFTLPRWNLVVLSAHPGPQIHRLRGHADWATEALAHELAHVWTHKRAGAIAEPDSYGVELGGVADVGPHAVGARIVATPHEPTWWSEGGAEQLSERIGVGSWHTARLRTVRRAALDDRWMTWEELQSSADRTDPGDGERVYQQGHAFARWLDQRYGAGTFDRIGAEAARGYRLRWDGLIRRVTGERAHALYDAHTAELKAEVERWAADRAALGLVEGHELRDAPGPWEALDLPSRDRWGTTSRREREEAEDRTGSWNVGARISADGRWRIEHRTGWTRIVPVDEHVADGPEAADLARARRERTIWLPTSFGSVADVIPGQDAAVVVASEHLGRSPLAPRSTDWDQLWIVDLAPEPETRRHRGGEETVGRLPLSPDPRELRRRIAPIPGTLRAIDPAVSPDGRRIAYLAYADGTLNLVVSGLDGADRRALTRFDDGTWMQHPRWSPDGDELVVGVSRNGQQNLWRVDVATGAMSALTRGPLAATDPWWSADGIVFVADPDGVSDVFRLDPDTGAVTRLTRVLGGAVSPSVTPAGDLLFSSYGGAGWKPRVLPRDLWLDAPTDAFPSPDPEEAARDLAFRADPALVGGELPVARYRPARAILPPAVSPILRIDATSAGVRPLGGLWLELRDAREVHELAIFGLVGDDRAASAAWTWRGLRPALTLSGEHELDRRVVGEDVDRRAIERGTFAVSWPWTDAWTVGADAIVQQVRVGGDQLEPALTTGRIGVELIGGGLAALTRPGSTGAAVSLRVTRGSSAVPGGDRYGYTQLRSSVLAVLPTGLGRPQRVEIGWTGVATDADLHPLEEVRGGGDHPYALRIGAVEPSLAFPGYAAWSLAGELAAIGTFGWRIPIAHGLARRLGPVTLDRVDARIAGDVGDVWTIDGRGHGAPVLADVVAELRTGARLAGTRWDSFVRLAWPLVEARSRSVDAAVPALDPTFGPRVYVGIGTGS